MRIDQINKRIHELETDIELLNVIKQELIENERADVFVRAVDDGIKYVKQRLEKYKTSDWIMADIKFE
jgi:hypothetical protein